MVDFDEMDDRILDAILKGLVEHGDSTRYFGSLGAHHYHMREAQRKGMLGPYSDPTQAGLEWYAQRKLSSLPEGRWMFWPPAEDR